LTEAADHLEEVAAASRFARYPPPMTGHDAEMDALRDQLAEAGLIEVYTDDQGGEAYRLTPEGEKVARQLAMTEREEEAPALLLAS